MAGSKKKAKASTADSVEEASFDEAAGQGRTRSAGNRLDRSTTVREPIRWSWPLKLVASLILVYHVAAMFIAPWSVPPTSSLAVSAQPWVAHYQTLLYLNHGYRFFAPNPGPASIVIYRVEYADGSVTEGLFPDRNAINREYPRLLYHRWFMLSESIGRFLGDQVSEAEFVGFQKEERAREAQLRTAGLVDEADRLSQEIEENLRLWNEAVKIRRQLLAPLARRIFEKHDSEKRKASKISLFLNRRMIPSVDQIRRGAKTRDPQFLPETAEILLGQWEAADISKEKSDRNADSEEVDEPEVLPLPIGSLVGRTR